ncbi:MAG: glycosyltransferase family 2 protein [Alphaproteobacteria bacterium]|nr:glycosyltransferase family 2 protein [Alphaproteobacteria bacterium]MDD9919694.1 glycosyltransferase family 2 protein [Alphaproteobacteria bacterium]
MAVEKNKHIDVSIVAPIYNEEDSIPHLVKKIHEVMSVSGKSWELVCVDDGSKDKSAEILAALQEDYPELSPVYFRRNYGQTAAMQAGFDHAKGDVLVTIDADLQNDPKDIPNLLEHLEKTGVDIVSGWRKNRQDAALKRNLPSKIANALIQRVTGIYLHDLGCSLKAYRREILEDVRIYGEFHRFIPIMASQNGATIDEVVVTHHARQFGQSKYGIDRTFRVVLDLILLKFLLTYMNRPMHAFGYLGLALLIPGGLLGTYLTALKILGQDIGGRPLLLLAIMLVLMGVQLIGMGVLGELMMRIYHEPHGRKQYTLKRKTPKKTAPKKEAAAKGTKPATRGKKSKS